MKSPRYTILIANRSNGAVRRLSIARRTAIAVLVALAALPLLIGLGASTTDPAELAALRSALSRNDLGYELISSGAYFAYVRHPHRGQSAADVARRLVDRQNLLALPGSMFGPDQEEYLRIAFANVGKDWMPQIATRLAADAAS